MFIPIQAPPINCNSAYFKEPYSRTINPQQGSCECTGSFRTGCNSSIDNCDPGFGPLCTFENKNQGGECACKCVPLTA